jgi:asparagine synthase (glutamine-hydrolysing)
VTALLGAGRYDVVLIEKEALPFVPWPVERALLARMADTLRHRGPDGEGFHTGRGIGLGFRRLSIVDLATGDQPIANETGSVVIVCNGEIYNHVELRAQLIAAGHRFRTASDAEVIVHLYEDHGIDFIRHLRGMFAIALWDAGRDELILVRDRLGIKPLHYAVAADGLHFASEQKAILAAGAVEPEPDLHALRQLFSYGRIVAPRTFVKDIRRLPAGHWLRFRRGHVTVAPYWDALFPPRAEYELRTSAQEWAQALHAKLAESVRLHLRSDVPVGAWLSGGVDSSAVTALMAGMLPGPVPTYTLRYEDARYDELRGRKALDDYPQFGLAGHRIVCRDGDFARLPASIWHGEDSLAGSIVVGQMLLARAASADVKVVLCGEGADEVLGGYTWYATSRVLAPVFALPAPVRRAIARVPPIRRRWPGAAGTIAGPRAMGFERYSRSVVHLRGQAIGEAIFAPDVLRALELDADVADAPPPPADFALWHPFAQMQYFDLKHRMADSVVLCLDRGSMAHGVEARVPFLDHEFVELCARIPPRVKMKWLREKDVLRRAMAGVLPPDIAGRRKWPMQLPTRAWLQGELPPFAQAALAEPALRRTGLFDPAGLADIRARQRAGGEDMTHVLSTVLGVQVWHDVFRRGLRDGGVSP